MVGNLVLLLASYAILYLTQRQNLFNLWFKPWKRRLTEFFVGIGFFGLVNVLIIYLDSVVRSADWIYTFKSYKIIYQSLWYHFNSALFEELIFRGIILHLLILRIGLKWSLLITSIAFGIYHWFTYGIFGSNLALMMFVLFITGTMGGVWAYSYYRTNSIVLAFGLHLGWNFVTTLLTESTPYGGLIAIANNIQPLTNEWHNLGYEISKGLLPALICFIFIKIFTAPHQRWIRTTTTPD